MALVLHREKNTDRVSLNRQDRTTWEQISSKSSPNTTKLDPSSAASLTSSRRSITSQEDRASQVDLFREWSHNLRALSKKKMKNRLIARGERCVSTSRPESTRTNQPRLELSRLQTPGSRTLSKESLPLIQRIRIKSICRIRFLGETLMTCMESTDRSLNPQYLMMLMLTLAAKTSSLRRVQDTTGICMSSTVQMQL